MLAQNFKLFRSLTQYCGISGALLFQWNNAYNILEVISNPKWSTALRKQRLQNVITVIVIVQALFAFNNAEADVAIITKILVGVSFVALLMGYSFFKTCQETAFELTSAVNGCIQFYETHKYCKLTFYIR